MKGIMGCRALSPCQRQMKRVRAVQSFYWAVPLAKRGFVAQTYTSQRSQSQKAQKALAASPRLQFVKLLLMSAKVWLSLPRIQLLRKFCLRGLSSLYISLMNSSLGFTNLQLCQILLQNCRKLIIFLMSKLMLLLCTMQDSSPNLKASEPQTGIPSPNSCFNLRIEASCSPFGKLLSLTLLIKLSRFLPSMTSKGSITLPLDLDILLPSESQTSGCRRTSLKGSLSVSQSDIITILATQKKRMSQPVYRIWLGKKEVKSGCSSCGHFRVEKGKRPELNQVSKTSQSCQTTISSFGKLSNFCAFCTASSMSRAATQFCVLQSCSGLSPFLQQKKAGMRCPHHSCLEMHQSLEFSIQRYQVSSSELGMMMSSLFLTTSTILLDISAHLTYHWGFIRGQMTSADRWHSPNLILLSFFSTHKFSFFSSSSITCLHSNRLSPLNFPPFSLMYPSSVKMLINSKWLRCPAAQSLWSWAGVILTHPVPNYLSTISSAIILSFLSARKGCSSSLPTRDLNLGSSGCTATAVSPNMVSILVVATTTN